MMSNESVLKRFLPLVFCAMLVACLAPALAFATEEAGSAQTLQIAADAPDIEDDDAETDEMGSADVGSAYIFDDCVYQVTSSSPATVVLVVAKNAKNVVVPDAVKIGDTNFAVTEITPAAFTPAKEKLTTVTIGKNVSVIDKRAFAQCAKLVKVKGGSGVQVIGNKAFAGCKKLTKCVPFSSKVLAQVGRKAFKGTKALETLTVKSTLLKKKMVKNSLVGSSVNTVNVKMGKKKLNETYVAKYVKIFAKANSGKKVAVK